MIPEITNNNVHLLIPGKAAHFARIYTEHHGGTMLEALRAFYSSKMYHELEAYCYDTAQCNKTI